MSYTKQERTNLVEEAQALVEEAQALVDEAVKGTAEQREYESYRKYGFDTLLGNGNPYDNGLHTLVERFRKL